MIQTLRLSDFTNAFRNSDRAEQFSYEALTILFDYFEALEDDLDTPIEFDMIGICCEWAEEMPEDIAMSYDIEFSDHKEAEQEVLNYLYSRTQVLGVTSKGTIVYCSSF